MNQAPNRLEILRTLRFANLDGAFATAFISLLSGTFMVGFVRMLHGADIWIGLLAAIPSLTGVFQAPGAVLGRRFASYKGYVMPGGLAWRALYLPIIILPLVGLATDVRLGLACGLIALASAAVMMVGPTYNEWLAEMVPADSRGVFFSRRNAILIATGALAALVGAVVLDLFRGAGLEAQGFSVVFGLGLACAGLSMGYYFKMFDLSRAEVRRTDFGQGVRELAAPLADRNFRRVLIFLAAFFVGQMFAGNLFSAFALETLRLPYTTIQGLSVLQAAGIVLAATAWGRLTDRHGTRPMLALSAAGIGLSPLLWLACRPGHDAANIAILAVGHLLIGLVWSGVGVCQFNILLATSPAKERATYLAAGFTVQTLLAGIAPILGAWMLTSMRGATSVEWAYKSVFLVTMAMRLSAVLLLVPVREEGSASIRSTARELLSKPGQTLRKTRAEKNEEPDDNPQIPA